jgi:hypothetical protein
MRVKKMLYFDNKPLLYIIEFLIKTLKRPFLMGYITVAEVSTRMAKLSEEDELCTMFLLSGESYGHISFQADGGPYISLWPSKRLKGLDSVPVKWYSTLHDEIKKERAPDKTYYVTNMNIDKITNWWEEFTEKDLEWSLLWLSCSNIVYKALGEGSDRFKGRVEYFATTPRAATDLVKSDMEDREATIKLGSSFKPSSSSK